MIVCNVYLNHDQMFHGRQLHGPQNTTTCLHDLVSHEKQKEAQEYTPSLRPSTRIWAQGGRKPQHPNASLPPHTEKKSKVSVLQTTNCGSARSQRRVYMYTDVQERSSEKEGERTLRFTSQTDWPTSIKLYPRIRDPSTPNT